jgi:hypothetical protein
LNQHLFPNGRQGIVRWIIRLRYLNVGTHDSPRETLR